MRLFVRYGLLAGTVLFLIWLAWQALSGGFRQMKRSHTAGQKIETATQVGCGTLSLLVALTCFRQRQSAPLIRNLWGISLATSAGLSALVWGPPMPFIGILFVAIALLLVRAVKGSLRTALIT